MSAKIIDGKLISAQIKEEAAKNATELIKNGVNPCLAVIIVGNDPASRVYVNNKKKACELCNIRSLEFALPQETTEKQLLELIERLNSDNSVNGILCQLPLPKHIDENRVTTAISPEKDADGFHPINQGNMLLGKNAFLPCTPAGVVEMLKRSDIDISGKHCVIIGRSSIVGKPAAILMLAENATVTICHSKTKGLSSVTRQADILISAIGKAGFVTADMVKEGAVVIDVGINRNADGKLCGDVDYDAVKDIASAITPVPGGVGPMTIAMLMKNTVEAAKRQKGMA